MKRWLPLTLLLAAAPALAQDFPFDSFPPQRLAAIEAEMLAEAAGGAPKVAGAPVIAYDARAPRARVRVTFTGQQRDIPDGKMRLIAVHFRAIGRDDASDIYQHEYAVLSEGKTYWLPMQKVLEPHIAEEIRPNLPVDLYLLRLGEVIVAGKTDIVLMVEEFAVIDG